jgi:uncharacterized protein YjbI with pentapeptide repeats
MLPGIGSAAALAYAAMVATFPDEHMYLATNWLHGIAPLNTLKLHGEDLIDDTKLAHILKKNESSSDEPRWVASFSVSDRDLTGADLGDADVRQVDFSGAILNRVKLDRAWADNAHFVYSDLQGASIWAAQLRGALLDHSKLQGASLNLAQLQGASLVEAQLQGASLDSVGLQGGSLDDAQLQGASLDDVHLQAASLDSAGLQGASLDHAQLHGATLDSAGLQGASLVGAKLQGTSFRNVFVWRADGGAANWKDTRVAGVNIGPKKRCYEPGPPPIGYDKDKVCNWTADTFEDLKRLIAKQIPEGYRREAAMKRIEERLDPGKNLPGEEEMAKIWTDHSPTPVVHKTYAEAMRAIASASEDYENSLAEQWHEIGCADEGAPYVLRALLRRLDDRDISPFASISPERAKLAADFLDESHCLGAHGLSEADRAKLKKIAATGTPPAPKP